MGFRYWLTTTALALVWILGLSQPNVCCAQPGTNVVSGRDIPADRNRRSQFNHRECLAEAPDAARELWAAEASVSSMHR